MEDWLKCQISSHVKYGQTRTKIVIHRFNVTKIVPTKGEFFIRLICHVKTYTRNTTKESIDAVFYLFLRMSRSVWKQSRAVVVVWDSQLFEKM